LAACLSMYKNNVTFLYCWRYSNGVPLLKARNSLPEPTFESKFV